MIEELDTTEVARAVELVRDTYRNFALRLSGAAKVPDKSSRGDRAAAGKGMMTPKFAF